MFGSWSQTTCNYNTSGLRWLTARAGGEYLTGIHDDIPFLYERSGRRDGITAVRKFEVRALPEGDFPERLNFVLRPCIDEQDEISEDEENLEMERLLTEKAGDAIRLYDEAQMAFYSLNFKDASYLVVESPGLLETDIGLLLNGLLLYINRQRSEAERYWEMASDRNPDIINPDMVLLEMMIMVEDMDIYEFSD